MSDIEHLRANAVASAAYDTVLQVSLRIVSFVLNAFIVRHVSSATFAVMSVRLYLLYATGLLLSREAFRRAALGTKQSADIRKVINLVWLGTAFCVPISFLGWLVWCHVMEEPPEDVTTSYRSGVMLIIVSFFVEVATEVPFVLSELQLWAKTRVIIEGLMQLLRSILIAIGIFLWPSSAILVFGWAYVSGSLLYCTLYYSLYAVMLRNKGKTQPLLVPDFWSLLPSLRSKQKGTVIDRELWSVSWSFFKQGWLKEALTEGELYLMNFFPLVSLSQQGVYQVVNNLGSLAARLVFRSIETASYKFFVQMLQRGVPVKEQNEKNVAAVAQMLKTLLKHLILFSFVIVAFGFSYSQTLLRLYGGTKLSEEGTTLMRAQCFYIVFLAVNGITEAYVFAAMSDKELERYNRSLILFSVIYVFVAVLATQFLGALGFIVANCINMMLRSVSSVNYMAEHFEGTPHKPLDSIQVSRSTGIIIFTVFVITSCSELFLFPIHMALHMLTGALSLLLLLYLLRYELQTPVEKVLRLLDNYVPNTTSDVLMTSAGDHSSDSSSASSFSKNYIVDLTHWFLFRRKLKLKVS